MLGLFNLLLVGLLLFIGLTAWMVLDRLRRPPRRSYATAVARAEPGDPGELAPPRRFRAFSFTAPAGRASGPLDLPAWEIEGDLPGNTDGPDVIVCPGWGDSKLGVLPRMEGLGPIARRVIAYDPAGMGEAPGKCNLGTDADAHALVALVESLGTDQASPVVLFGWSMGAGIALHAATILDERGRGPVAVIAEAPYRLVATPVVNYLKLVRLPHRTTKPIALTFLGWRLRGTLDWSGFDRAGFAARLRCPLLVIHGSKDEICPIDDGRRVASAAKSALCIEVAGAGHNNLWTEESYRTQCARAVGDFVRAAIARTGR